MDEVSKTGLNHKNARTPEQIELMRKIEEDGVCPFCKEYFPTYHPKPILKETDFWFVTENMSPYEGTTKHLLFVYKPEHISHPEKMVAGAGDELIDLVAWASSEFNIEGGSFFMRFGNTKYNGSSVEHLHAQLLTGVQESDKTEAIRVKLGHKKK